MDQLKPWDFFDWANEDHCNKCGLGFIPYLNASNAFLFKANYDVSSNNKGESLACFYLLRLSVKNIMLIYRHLETHLVLSIIFLAHLESQSRLSFLWQLS